MSLRFPLKHGAFLSDTNVQCCKQIPGSQIRSIGVMNPDAA